MKTIQIPGSKSYTNRALIMAALSKASIINPLYSEDTEALISILRTLGLDIVTKPNRIEVRTDIGEVQDRHYSLFAHDSGTTVRFVLALSCILPGVETIQGSPGLNERPIRDLVDALRSMGAKIEYCQKEGKLPVKVLSHTFEKNFALLKSDLSSQFCSAILLTSPYFFTPSQDFTLHLTTPLISKPYVNMTVEYMRKAGVRVEGEYFIPACNGYRLQEYVIEGDFSSASYFFASAVLTQSSIAIENLSSTSLQADRHFLTILENMGNPVHFGKNCIQIEGRSLIPVDVDMENCPDQVMTMAVLAAFAKGVSRISGVRSLRVKETERVVALRRELGKMGIETEDTHDTLTIRGGAPHAAEIDTYNDHRMAMSFAVASARLPNMVIRNPEVVRKTFPAFFEKFNTETHRETPRKIMKYL